MDEIVARPKYSRQTGAQRRRRREINNNEMISTLFAVKLLIVVVILTVLALCKAANTPATNTLLSKVKVVTTSNYDINRYLIKAAAGIGISLPQSTPAEHTLTEQEKTGGEENKKEKDAVSGEIIPIEKESGDVADTQVPPADTAKTSEEGVQVLHEQEIKQLADKLSMVFPIKGEIASSFGTRVDPLSGTSQFHKGIDIEAKVGVSIKAALGGEIIEADANPEYGSYIKIKHTNDIVTVYAHCSMLIGKVGQKVNQGDVIAKVGDTEGMEGAYLHFEVWKGDQVVDPEKLLNYING